MITKRRSHLSCFRGPGNHLYLQKLCIRARMLRYVWNDYQKANILEINWCGLLKIPSDSWGLFENLFDRCEFCSSESWRARSTTNRRRPSRSEKISRSWKRRFCSSSVFSCFYLHLSVVGNSPRVPSYFYHFSPFFHRYSNFNQIGPLHSFPPSWIHEIQLNSWLNHHRENEWKRSI